MTATKKWDRVEIKAELDRRGLTLTGIAKDAGLYESACRQGILGASRRGAEAIANALGVPFREMFPDSYVRGRHDEMNSISNTSCNGRTKSGRSADTPRSVA